ncbi:uncharacterized protein clmnb isoform X1 [Osmerus eperlanus]|uniref:uncharacterized protein clmnb isoform X1 n=1 Tax=Osmerus eperlanus TaxID=29151 RepID=UPI002E15AE1B
MSLMARHLDKSLYDQGESTGQTNVGVLKGEREAIQKRTFTRWINAHLEKFPIKVEDLFTDIQDGRVLLALLEELSGCRLYHRFRPSSYRIFRLNNIAKALAFLDDRHVKLPSIDVVTIADGVPSAVLGLIWNIILFFQIKEVTSGLQKHLSSSLSSLPISCYPSPCDLSPVTDDFNHSNTLPSKGRKAASNRQHHGKAIKTLLHWVHRRTSKFGVSVLDFGTSWSSGLAFLALVKSVAPGLVDLRNSLSRDHRDNVREAFMIAQSSLGIPTLLDPDDVTRCAPDERSIITYVSQFPEHYPGPDEDLRPDFESRKTLLTGRDVQLTPKPHGLTPVKSVSFGPTSPSCEEAQTLSISQEMTNEQLPRMKQTNGPSDEPWLTPAHLPEITFSKVLRVPSLHQSKSPTPGSNSATEINIDSPVSLKYTVSTSPLGLSAESADAGVWFWMETAPEEISSERCVDEGIFSQSSEEGVYMLSTLDSDEEEAYNYILGLNREVCDVLGPSDQDYGELLTSGLTPKLAPEQTPGLTSGITPGSTPGLTPGLTPVLDQMVADMEAVHQKDEHSVPEQEINKAEKEQDGGMNPVSNVSKATVRRMFAMRMEEEDRRGEESKGEEDLKEDGGRTEEEEEKKEHACLQSYFEVREEKREMREVVEVETVSADLEEEEVLRGGQGSSVKDMVRIRWRFRGGEERTVEEQVGSSWHEREPEKEELEEDTTELKRIGRVYFQDVPSSGELEVLFILWILFYCCLLFPRLDLR